MRMKGPIDSFIERRIRQRHTYTKWFAWRPIKTIDRHWVWLEYVEFHRWYVGSFYKRTKRFYRTIANEEKN